MGSLRVSGGSLRGRKVPLPRYELRPTSGRAREAFFNVVAPSIAGASFLDLFAGTGIFSIEAASRGAARIVAVDDARRAIQPLAALAREWKLPVETMLTDAIQAVARLAPAPPFDLVYADPPYDYSRYEELVAAIDRQLPLADDAVVALEHRSREIPFEASVLTRLALRKTSRYGNVAITYLGRTA